MLYFILNEGLEKNRYNPGANIEFFSDLDALRRNTEPQDFEFGDYHINDSEGFEYEIRYTPKPNSVDISKGVNRYESTTNLVRQAFKNNGWMYKEELSLTQNIDILVRGRKQC